MRSWLRKQAANSPDRSVQARRLAARKGGGLSRPERARMPGALPEPKQVHSLPSAALRAGIVRSGLHRSPGDLPTMELQLSEESLGEVLPAAKQRTYVAGPQPLGFAPSAP